MKQDDCLALAHFSCFPYSGSSTEVAGAEKSRRWPKLGCRMAAGCKCTCDCEAAEVMEEPLVLSPARATWRCIWRRSQIRYRTLKKNYPSRMLWVNDETKVESVSFQVNPAEEKLARWTTCKLSGEKLEPPCVVDELGSLYNKASCLRTHR